MKSTFRPKLEDGKDHPKRGEYKRKGNILYKRIRERATCPM
jgi:hypothetical protein